MDRKLLEEHSNPPDGGCLTFEPVEVKLQGVMGQLTLQNESLQFQALHHGDDTQCCAASPASQSLALKDMVGATASNRTLSLWTTSDNSSGPKRTRKLVKVHFTCASDQVAQRAATAIRPLVRAPQLQHAQVVINPVSGQGRAKALYNKEYAPMLEAAGLRTSVLVTEHAGHAKEEAQRWDVSSVDAVVCLGGDGTVHEVIQGLMARPDWSEAIQAPLLQLPAGSGNALCANAGYFNGVAAIQALLQYNVVPLDLFAVTQPSRQQTYYCFLSITYGIIACMDVGTEHLRWMGGTRVLVGGLQQLLSFPKHTADVSVLPSTAAVAGATAGGSGGTNGSAPKDRRIPMANSLAGIDLQQPLLKTSLPQGWAHQGDDPYVVFMLCNLKWLDNDMFAPAQQAGPSTGCLDLICMRDCSRGDALSMLLQSDKLASHPAVQYQKIQGMVLRPTASKTWLVLDGESIPFEPIVVEMLPGMAQLIVANG